MARKKRHTLGKNEKISRFALVKKEDSDEISTILNKSSILFSFEKKIILEHTIIS
jgi:hypothetical protein